VLLCVFGQYIMGEEGACVIGTGDASAAATALLVQKTSKIWDDDDHHLITQVFDFSLFFCCLTFSTKKN
jgi:hypothetical protein